MKNKVIIFWGILFLSLLLFEACQSQPLVLSASVNGQQYGTIEVYKIIFANDSKFTNQLNTVYFADHSTKSGAVDFPYRPSFEGSASAHMGCSQAAGYPGGPAKLTFEGIELKSGSVVWVRIVYSKNSPETDSLKLYYGKNSLVSFIPHNWNSWGEYHNEDFKIKIP